MVKSPVVHPHWAFWRPPFSHCEGCWRCRLFFATRRPRVRHMLLSDLTPRQRQMALLVAQGLTRASIARQLSEPGQRPLSIRTVDVHIQTIAGRLPNDGPPATRRVRRWAQTQIVVP